MIGAGGRLTLVLLGLVALVAGPNLLDRSSAGATVVPELVRVDAGGSVTCRADSGRLAVAVVVAFAEGEAPVVRCADLAAGASGIDALRAAGFSLRIESGFICGIDGVPARGCATGSGFDGSYWRYFRAVPGGDWTYAASGAGYPMKTHSGCAVEGWLWSGTSTISPPPISPGVISCVHGADPTTPPTTRPAVPPRGSATTLPGSAGPSGSPAFGPSNSSAPPATLAQRGSGVPPGGASGAGSGPITGGDEPGGSPNGSQGADPSGSVADAGAVEVKGSQEPNDLAVGRSTSSVPAGSRERKPRREAAAGGTDVLGSGDDSSAGSPVALVVALTLAGGIGAASVLFGRRRASGAE